MKKSLNILMMLALVILCACSQDEMGDGSRCETDIREDGKTEYYYNASNQLYKVLDYSKNDAGYVLGRQRELTYDEAGLPAMVTASVYNAMATDSKTVFTSNGNKLSEALLYTRPSLSDEEWILSEKRTDLNKYDLRVKYYIDGFDKYTSYRLVGEEWVKGSYNEIISDDGGIHLTRIMLSDWNDGSFLSGSKAESVFNSDGKVVSSIGSRWINNDWVLYHKTENEYSESGKITLSVSYDRADGEWIPYSKSVYGYDETGKPTFYTSYMRNNGEWVTSSESEYDSDGRIKSATRYNRIFGELQSKTVDDYDKRGLVVLSVTYQYVDGEWALYSKYEYEYNENGLRTLQVWYEWQNGNWVPTRKYEYSRDSTGKQTMKCYIWQDGAWVLQGTY